MSNKETAEMFEKQLYENYRTAGKETGYWGRYFLRELKAKGAVATTKRMLKPAKDTKIGKGFQALIDAGRIELSVEATALDDQYRQLFTDAEIEEAERRLGLVPDYAKTREVGKAEIHPDQIDDNTEYPEGSARKVLVNAYERNPKAREACLKKHGYRCCVCNMNFREKYGEIGKGFIHVHHKKPLALRRKEYKIRPTIDLVPVCPNCHAMLHTTNPPRSIEDLRSRIS